jgi:hypothetical protein
LYEAILRKFWKAFGSYEEALIIKTRVAGTAVRRAAQHLALRLGLSPALRAGYLSPIAWNWCSIVDLLSQLLSLWHQWL